MGKHDHFPPIGRGELGSIRVTPDAESLPCQVCRATDRVLFITLRGDGIRRPRTWLRLCQSCLEILDYAWRRAVA